MVREWIPVPGSAKARLLEAAIDQFERFGFEAANVVEIASAAGTTTGSLYHHFDSKLGLFQIVRQEMERRIRDRLEGAWAGAGGGWQGVTAALLVSFDAAVRFKAARILSEPVAGLGEDLVLTTLETLVQPAPPAAAAVMAGLWRAALSAASASATAEEARRGLEWVLASGGYGPGRHGSRTAPARP